MQILNDNVRLIKIIYNIFAHNYEINKAGVGKRNMNGIKYVLCFVSVLLLGACTSQKQIRYFNDLPDSAIVDLPPLKQEPRFIQEGDRLMIDIGAEDPRAANAFNNYGGTDGTSGGVRGVQETSGFLVNTDGYVEIGYLGKVKAAGLTTDQLKADLESKLQKYMKTPIVLVRFFLFKFTVLGEVRRPGTYTLPLQRTTFLDALGAAGDLPNSAKRSNIMIYRDYNGKRTVFTVDLRKKDILFNADQFQIKHNDIIYVKPRDSRFFSEETRFYVSMLTLLVGVYAIFLRYSK